MDKMLVMDYFTCNGLYTCNDVFVFHAQLQLAFSYTLTREANWLHWTKSWVVYREPKHVDAFEQCSESSNHKLRETMSWMQGPIDPPPPHPNLEVRTRSFYDAHNSLPVQFWPHFIMETTLLYRSTSCLVMQDDGSSVALTMRFDIFDIYVSFHGRTFL